jgi:hypothetical protein
LGILIFEELDLLKVRLEVIFEPSMKLIEFLGLGLNLKLKALFVLPSLNHLILYRFI